MRLSTCIAVSLGVLAAACASPPAGTGSAGGPGGEAAFRALYKELIETNTTYSEGSCTLAAERIKARLLAAGYPESDLTIVQAEARPQDGNLVAVLHGSDPALKPILLLAHIDVVEAKREDWERDPFVLTEEDGYFYARGAIDDKAMAAIWADSMIRYRREGYAPARTIKMALTCGEETTSDHIGVTILLREHRALIDAEFALNEGAGGRIDADTGRYVFNGVQAGEKLYQDYTLSITNPGGHSSRPVPDNAIYRLAAALRRIEVLEFPIQFNDATRGFFARMADIDGGPLAADMKAAAATGDPAAVARLRTNPTYNAMMRTTCVATQLAAGHAPNALPQRAEANVNCRIFPGGDPDDVRRRLSAAAADEAISVEFADPPETIAPMPPLTAEIMAPIERLTAEMFPGVPVVPAMATGATDGRFLNAAGIPTYGVSGIFTDPTTSNAHGLNERVGVKQLMDGRRFLYSLVKAYAGGK